MSFYMGMNDVPREVVNAKTGETREVVPKGYVRDRNEACRILCCGPHGLHSLMGAGKLRQVEIFGNLYWRRADLENLHKREIDNAEAPRRKALADARAKVKAAEAMLKGNRAERDARLKKAQREIEDAQVLIPGTPQHAKHTQAAALAKARGIMAELELEGALDKPVPTTKPTSNTKQRKARAALAAL